MGDDGVMALCQGFDFENLLSLDMASNQISDRGIQLLCTLGHFPQLKELGLRRNHIGDEGVKIFCNSHFAKQLNRVNLDYGINIIYVLIKYTIWIMAFVMGFNT